MNELLPRVRRSRPVPYLLGALLFVALFLHGGSARADSAANAIAELTNRRNLEVALLHLPIDRVVLGALPVWDEKTGKLRLRVPGESFDDSRAVLILHLWATWCGPCKEEFGQWKQLGEQLEHQFGYEVKIIHIALQRDASAMAGLVKKQGSKMPLGPKFFDQDERLSNLLQAALNTKDLPALPITLWLGPARTVRQVLMGAISGRSSEVLDSTERLLRNLKYLRETTKTPPKDEEGDVFTQIGPCRCPCVCN